MGKEHRHGRDDKKKPLLSLKERRQKKHEKHKIKEEEHRMDIPRFE
jgi:hypothetical protein